MRADWDLWPMLVAAGAPDPAALPVFLLEGHVRDVQRALALALWPALRPVVRLLAERAA